MEETAKKDEEVARAVQQGNGELFGILIVRYEKKMMRYASKFLYHPDDTKDAVQEIFTKAYVNLKSFDANRKFSSWLYRLAHNELINILKKQSRRRFLPLFDLDIFLPSYARQANPVDEEMEKKETRALVDKCLDKLAPKYREPTALYYLEELSYKEIAEVMRIPVSTVGIRIKRAKTMMHKMLTDQNHGQR